MAYTTGTLTYIAGGPIEGAWKLWEYTTANTLAQVTAPAYISDATFVLRRNHGGAGAQKRDQLLRTAKSRRQRRLRADDAHGLRDERVKFR